ncbi:MAG: hypothetical protein ACT6S0_14145 [Roseateles sp.]|uniref:hypothetical protein n=1 Tax=Roseateles sp. TaxID=1971397 RepID=UPI004036C1E6
MSLFIEANLRQRARAGTPLNKSLGTVLQERVKVAASAKQFDIFLSHSFNDQELILGIMMSLEDLGYKVYVDWVHDGELNREHVSPQTAALLRIRMEMSKCLFYATTATTRSGCHGSWVTWTGTTARRRFCRSPNTTRRRTQARSTWACTPTS